MFEVPDLDSIKFQTKAYSKILIFIERLNCYALKSIKLDRLCLQATDATDVSHCVGIRLFGVFFGKMVVLR